MISKVNTASLWGLDGHLVCVETDVERGLPAWNVVGLGDKTIKEAIERIRSAISNSGYEYPRQRITINLSPAGKPKEGTHFDLPVAVGTLLAAGAMKGEAVDEYAFVGELSLGGEIRKVKGVLPLVMTCRDAGISKIFVPEENVREATLVSGVDIYVAHNLKNVVEYFDGKSTIVPIRPKEFPYESIARADVPSFDDVRGHDTVKRAMAIAASGMHAILMIGSPGSGKSMLANRLPGIMPAMSYEEMLEVTKIYSVAGLLNSEMPIVKERPFRNPHRNVTIPALLGGGAKPVPGEFSLAHMGVLFLDELPEFDRRLINSLRQPLETEEVIINRAQGTARFPGKILFAAAGNPCMCGWEGDSLRRCTCTAGQLSAYTAKLSGPIIDRIDIYTRVNRVSPTDNSVGIRALDMRQMVCNAREMQQRRFANESIKYNSQMDVAELKRFCGLQPDAENILNTAYKQFPLTMRTYHKTIKLARTIADMECKDEIEFAHVAEALRYRREANGNYKADTSR